MSEQKVQLEITEDALRQQAREFLMENGLTPSPQNIGLFGAYVQHSPQDSDLFDPSAALAQIRKALANRAAYQLIVDAQEAEKREQEEAAKSKGPDEEVVQEAGTGGV